MRLPMFLLELPKDSPMVQHLLDSNNPNADSFMAEFFTMIVMLGLTLIGMLIVAWFLKRFLYSRLQQTNSTSGIRISERRTLGPRSMIYLVEIEGSRFIVGETPSGLVRLGDLPTAPAQRPTSFSKLMDEPLTTDKDPRL
ncbi:MAG: flagellar biosynthetic protein FliO [Chlamydiales bacterium]|nr:flagellar biosynthetic protein FliO [Chlamydiales bacterium]